MLVYLGLHLDRFVAAFGTVGTIFVRLAAPRDEHDHFQQPPPSRPRLDIVQLEAVKQQYLDLKGVDRNVLARWTLDHQLRQTDLTPRQKSSLAKVLEALTTYTSEVPS